jgi:hypothetical protein
VRAALASSGLAGDRLVLELVETSLVALPQRTLAAMSELAGRGVRFAVDDFGTGYSSLSRIKELPAQIVKVDRTFVQGISSDPADFAVARAVVQMAAAMGRYCVAEGVETADQFHALRGLGVDAYQGWLFAKAMEPTAFRAMLVGPPLPVPAGQPTPAPDGLATMALPTESVRASRIGTADSPPVSTAQAPASTGPGSAGPGSMAPGAGPVGSAPASPGPLGGFDTTPDAFATPIADLLASLLARVEADESERPEPSANTDPADGLGFGMGADPLGRPSGRPGE